ncbi:MAG: hypothetical protein FD169_1565 [Bacillota bacterium]|nr:MAG: hypothetical protein FD169_1565 [Bacillota bacterium]MBS3951168.1 hypothetical protein [Peptococcaceae bacterium]
MASARSLVWIILFLISALAMVILVPRRRIWELLAFGIVGGLALAMAVQYVAVVLLKLWSFNYLQIAAWRGIPLFVAGAWMPSVIIFAHFLSYLRSSTGILLYVVSFSLVTAGLEYTFVLMGYRNYLNWMFPYTAALAIVLHGILALYILTFARERRRVRYR